MRGVLDRAMVAKRIWESCTIPEILYCVEAMTLKKTTIVELERLQGMVGRFILHRSLPHPLRFLPGWMLASCLWHTESRPDRLCSSGIF